MAFGIQIRVAAWAVWDGGDEALRVGGDTSPRPALPSSLRRRVSALGRRALEAAWTILPDGVEPRLVLASRHGEYARTFDLLMGLAQSDEVSPAEFSLAVHHALAGLLSIATGNRQGHIAVAAGPDSFGYGLLEAAAFVAEQNQPALLMHFDEPLPEGYAPVAADDCDTAHVLAALVVPQSWPRAVTLDMRAEAVAEDGASCGPRAFAAVLAEGGEQVARGGRHAWRWRHVA